MKTHESSITKNVFFFIVVGFNKFSESVRGIEENFRKSLCISLLHCTTKVYCREGESNVCLAKVALCKGRLFVRHSTESPEKFHGCDASEKPA